ncbi:hypothetical protein CBS76997_5840 [Aspergillus niger]|uniref:Uncharacterized protein n=2 Tax=Aspergillus niger TaxID=5061 RepID=G3Y609_ASPNA|nr:uncharacterized protein BO96DRAFT_408330 [Aspergillus niger CBS 101883]EHA22025.1 hypothetical protein ASPNIDRAFT_53600 [Aspergillus niger ATCC 1015]KAI2893204.1 hypothetical protein CBS11852_5474 [Aspergillus niger]KAI2895638.1 hypothetical protein CBS13152_3706 [Aspergillus niger]KAI2969403.1 hypothetical protein CBS147323_3958 [Aspergillus niger]KAI3028239.1 hypothetical protein CBS147347_4202 [Aspergillus niger]
MHTAALFLALALSAHAVPVLHARGNDTVERREEDPYKVVNVAGPTTPVVETITATNPPAPPTTITVTEYPSSTPASVPGASPSPWNAGPTVDGAPLNRRETNSSASAFRRRVFTDDATNSTASRRAMFSDDATTNSTLSRRARFEDDATTNKTESRREILDHATNSTLSRRKMFSDDATNSTENHAIATRSNDTIPAQSQPKVDVIARGLLSEARNETEHRLQARSNITSEVVARSNDTIAKAMARRSLYEGLESDNSTARVVARSNDTVSKLVTREIGDAESALNSSKVLDHKVRGLNETALQARAFNDTPSDTAVMSSRPHARGLNHTDSQA